MPSLKMVPVMLVLVTTTIVMTTVTGDVLKNFPGAKSSPVDLTSRGPHPSTQ
jgi:hypothetical protein